MIDDFDVMLTGEQYSKMKNDIKQKTVSLLRMQEQITMLKKQQIIVRDQNISLQKNQSKLRKKIKQLTFYLLKLTQSAFQKDAMNLQKEEKYLIEIKALIMKLKKSYDETSNKEISASKISFEYHERQLKIKDQLVKKLEETIKQKDQTLMNLTQSIEVKNKQIALIEKQAQKTMQIHTAEQLQKIKDLQMQIYHVREKQIQMKQKEINIQEGLTKVMQKQKELQETKKELKDKQDEFISRKNSIQKREQYIKQQQKKNQKLINMIKSQQDQLKQLKKQILDLRSQSQKKVSEYSTNTNMIQDSEKIKLKQIILQEQRQHQQTKKRLKICQVQQKNKLKQIEKAVESQICSIFQSEDSQKNIIKETFKSQIQHKDSLIKDLEKTIEKNEKLFNQQKERFINKMQSQAYLYSQQMLKKQIQNNKMKEQIKNKQHILCQLQIKFVQKCNRIEEQNLVLKKQNKFYAQNLASLQQEYQVILRQKQNNKFQSIYSNKDLLQNFQNKLKIYQEIIFFNCTQCKLPFKQIQQIIKDRLHDLKTSLVKHLQRELKSLQQKTERI